jgi:hypothetical protein
MTRRMLPLGLVILVLLMASSAWEKEGDNPKAPDGFPSDVASAWFDLLYDVVKTEQSSPPVASRIYGVAAVTLYEAIVPGSRENKSLVGQLNALASVPQLNPHKTYHWPTVANAALAQAIKGLFPTASSDSLSAINTLEEAFAAQFQASVPPPVYERSVAQGQVVAEAVLTWASTDGFTILNNCPYTPPVGPGLWVPAPPNFVPNPLQPCWGQLRPLVLTSSDECAPPPPPAYSADPSSEFYVLALEVYNTNLHLTDEQTTIALYWADNPGATGTPPGHWVAIVGQIARNNGLSLMAAPRRMRGSGWPSRMPSSAAGRPSIPTTCSGRSATFRPSSLPTGCPSSPLRASPRIALATPPSRAPSPRSSPTCSAWSRSPTPCSPIMA